jgi:hypothetical protein
VGAHALTGPPCQHEHDPRCPMITINPKDAAPARRDQSRPPGPPEPGRTRGLARRDRGNRPHPRLPAPETRPDPAAGPHRAHRPGHARRALHRAGP